VLTGVPIGRDMDGMILKSLLQPGFLESMGVAYVDSHDTPEWLAARDRSRAELPGREERLEQLRALGYLVDDVEADPEPRRVPDG
jgi:hypothetical protein